MVSAPKAFGASKVFASWRKAMIETRSQNLVAGGVDPGAPEGCHLSAPVASARGYNLAAANRDRRPQQLKLGND